MEMLNKIRKIIFGILLWILSGFMLISALVIVADSVPTAVSMLLGALVCNPLVLKKTHLKWKVSVPAFIVLFFITVFLYPGTTQQEDLAINVDVQGESEIATETAHSEVASAAEIETSKQELTEIESTEVKAVESESIETESPETKPIESGTLSQEKEFINALTQNPDVTEEAAKATYSILTEDMGFNECVVKENQAGMTLFYVSADGYNLKVTVSDKPYMILCGSYNMYKDDTLAYTKQDLDDRNVGDNASAYYVMATEAVSSALKNPSGANFCSLNECQIGRNKEYVVVKGYVDATNSFGAQVRSEFVVEISVVDLSDYLYDVVYINIDGESAGTYVEIN